MPSVENILAVILGGGRGTRLFPLTKERSKPAVPIAGKYRLIDIPLSNCINSGIYHIAVLTQFNSVSLHRHISSTYHFDSFHSGWVQLWAAEQTIQSADWYQGTADAVRKQLFEIKSTLADYVLILAGDHLYRMDYHAMANFHWDHDADVTVAVQPVLRQDATRFGLLKRDEHNRITRFAEKPKDAATQQEMVSRSDRKRPYLGSMGIYIFKTAVLLELLETTDYDDFGSQVIPHAISDYNVMGYDYEGYWEDIGTIRSFYETNLALTNKNSPFDFYDTDMPVYTRSRFLPGSIVENSQLEDCLLAEGCIITNAKVTHSVVGIRTIINSGSTIKDCVIMGSDYFKKTPLAKDKIAFGIGAECEIEGAIIDKNVRIGQKVIIKPFPEGTDLDGRNYYVRDGIVVIPKGAVIPAGTVIMPE